MWHQQVSGTQVSGQYYLYGGCEGMQEGMHVENGKSHRQSFFPGAADRSVMRSMPHLLKRGTAVSSGDHRKGHLSRGPTQEERTPRDSWGTPWRSDRRTCPQVLLAGNPHRITLASHTHPFDRLWDTWCRTRLSCTGTRQWFSAVMRERGAMPLKNEDIWKWGHGDRQCKPSKPRSVSEKPVLDWWVRVGVRKWQEGDFFCVF